MMEYAKSLLQACGAGRWRAGWLVLKLRKVAS